MIRKLKNIVHFFIAFAANIYYGFPGSKIKVIGVTGTDGKTTTTSLIYHILTSAGYATSMISSVYAKVGTKEYDTGFHVTTPSPFAVQRYLAEAVKKGDQYFVLESTAHALDQNRVWGIKYHISVITNIAHEHIKSKGGYDYFNTYDNYSAAKAKLLLNSNIAIINKDDQSFPYLQSLIEKKKNVIVKTYALDKVAIYNWTKDIKTDLPGEFNKYNILAAYAVTDSLGVDHRKILKGIRTFTLPSGRFEVVYKRSFIAIIDFAHTIQGISAFLKAVKSNYKIKAKNRIIHVFGAAGLRDETKRPVMGEASAENADIIVLTEEDYRTEKPEIICRQIAQGIESRGFVQVSPHDIATGKNKYTVVLERKDAIDVAVAAAQPGDIVVLTGKGHEKSLTRGKKDFPWNEKKVLLKAITSRK